MYILQTKLQQIVQIKETHLRILTRAHLFKDDISHNTLHTTGLYFKQNILYFVFFHFISKNLTSIYTFFSIIKVPVIFNSIY